MNKITLINLISAFQADIAYYSKFQTRAAAVEIENARLTIDILETKLNKMRD